MDHPSLETNENFSTFLEVLASVLHERFNRPTKTTMSKSKAKRRADSAKAKKTSGSKKSHQTIAKSIENKNSRRLANEKTQSDIDNNMTDLMDFISYIASSIFLSMPTKLQELSHYKWNSDSELQSQYNTATLTPEETSNAFSQIPVEAIESLEAYSVLEKSRDESIGELLLPVLQSYISMATAAPPPPRTTRDEQDGCEICGRDWIELTFHHLIPRMVHEKVIRKGWHRRDELNNVAWLCRACHNFVHRFASHEDLAMRFYTVDLLLGHDDVQRWAKWASTVRWKGSMRCHRVKGESLFGRLE